MYMYMYIYISSTRSAYNLWRVWNVAKTQLGVFRKEYKGGRIVEKATGKFVLSPRGYESTARVRIATSRGATRERIARMRMRRR